MKRPITVDIKIPSQTKYLSFISKIAQAIVSEMSIAEKSREKLTQTVDTAITEGLVNAITHANKTDPEKEVHIHICASEDDLIIRVYDQGSGFNINSIANECSADPLSEHGRGIFIIRSVMDSVEYEKSNGDGNVLTMKKSFVRGK